MKRLVQVKRPVKRTVGYGLELEIEYLKIILLFLHTENLCEPRLSENKLVRNVLIEKRRTRNTLRCIFKRIEKLHVLIVEDHRPKQLCQIARRRRSVLLITSGLKLFRVICIKGPGLRVRMAEKIRLHLQLVNDVFGLLTELSLISRLARIDYRSFRIAETRGNRS